MVSAVYLALLLDVSIKVAKVILRERANRRNNQTRRTSKKYYKKEEGGEYE